MAQQLYVTNSLGGYLSVPKLAKELLYAAKPTYKFRCGKMAELKFPYMLERPKSLNDYQGETIEDDTMGNQQEILTQSEIGYLAGIIDGEGSIAMNVRKKK